MFVCIYVCIFVCMHLSAALPAFISEREKSYYRSKIFSRALLSDGTAKVGSTGSLTWSGNVDDMRAYVTFECNAELINIHHYGI